ncbi:MAG: 2-oxo acid dehydrogenase subunit E2, partial [Chitinophagales bacterium]|nr:2-oxo acid dehydrogenase subunit E2 [Chitinophagales bacterium]
MPTVELLMPKMGESIMEATILTWNKQVGDSVAVDEAVLEIATDKVDSEVPSEVAGTIVKLLYKEGDVVAVGAAVALISTGGDDSSSQESTSVEEVSVKPEVSAASLETEINAQVSKQNSLQNSDANRFYSPLVMSMAKEENISMSELE